LQHTRQSVAPLGDRAGSLGGGTGGWRGGAGFFGGGRRGWARGGGASSCTLPILWALLLRCARAIALTFPCCGAAGGSCLSPFSPCPPSPPNPPSSLLLPLPIPPSPSLRSALPGGRLSDTVHDTVVERAETTCSVRRELIRLSDTVHDTIFSVPKRPLVCGGS
jgi:hypothetical protein